MDNDMKIYLVTVPSWINVGWGETNGAVIAAENESRALLIANHAEDFGCMENLFWPYYGEPYDLMVDYVGMAEPSTEPSVILESTNPG